MAILSKLIVGACALASVVYAAPVVTVTEVETVTSWITQNSTTTVWRPLNESPLATPTASPEQATSAETVAGASSAVLHIQEAPVPSIQPASPSVVVTPVQPEPVAPTLPPVPATPSTTTPAVQQAPSTLQTSTTAAVPRAAAPSAAAAAGGQCEGSGSPCTGDVTHWDGGLGACGWNVNTESDMQIALPVGLMGSQSNGNPYCGRSVTIKNPTTGTTMSATVGDKCMGCAGTAIDLTNALFKAVTGGTGDGREPGFEWWFN